MPVDTICQEIISLVEEVKAQQRSRDEFLANCERFSENEEALVQLLGGQTKDEHAERYQRSILELLDRIDNANQRIMAEFEDVLPDRAETKAARTVVHESKAKSFYLGRRTRKKYLHDIGASDEILERLTKKKEKKIKSVPEYTVYRTSAYGRLSNAIAGRFTRIVISSYPQFYKTLAHSLRMADLGILSRTYVSCQLFTSLLVYLVTLCAAVLVNILFGSPMIFAVVTSIALALLFAVFVFGVFYYYPMTVVNSRSRMIKNDLPFAIIHMAAVAGSGAKPISVFRLLLSSGEYKGLGGEVKKIVNYVNLFGYNLSTALKTVAATTPSNKLRNLLNGMVATIESGGSLKSYLNNMADDAMNTYKLERKKYVETLSTYSDIYTGILIAAPLLFVVILAIINVLGGTIGGLSIRTITFAGTFVVLPFLNIVFILFLNIIQPEV